MFMPRMEQRIYSLIQYKYFKGANKPEKFLAHQLKKRKERKIIEKIMVEGKEIIEEKEIKETFLKFYSKLYREDGTREYR